ncbi:putative serine/threonine-protein kinase WNK11 [Silene latifolia]|uniref:putative serine/threonine-protein kinase WNK11 n=1 Tax=Silene latifolia TaxID=37657 RepID=UPI003D773282
MLSLAFLSNPLSTPFLLLVSPISNNSILLVTTLTILKLSTKRNSKIFKESPKRNMDYTCDDVDDPEIVEKDPTGRYVRYDDVLGEGTWKKVYRGFDEVDGIEVAWSQVDLSSQIMDCPKLLKSLCDEAKILKSLKHENVMRCYHSWVDLKNKRINMITELFTSGDLQHYCKKHTHLDRKPIKNWARQILKALSYLHSHNPPIIHRDLKCENIFVNGNSGRIKIGDLGFAVELDRASACKSVTGTPGFMAPELYEEEYNELVDVYAFGMCMLQMVIREEPYHECENHAQIYNKTRKGIKPAGLAKVKDPQVRDFIDKCLAPVSERPAAIDLLNDPFFDDDMPATPGELEKVKVNGDKKVRLRGKMMEVSDAISMTLEMANSSKIEYLYYLESDTINSVMEEMGKEVEISSEDCEVISELMEGVIAGLRGRCSKSNQTEVKPYYSKSISKRVENVVIPAESISKRVENVIQQQQHQSLNPKKIWGRLT